MNRNIIKVIYWSSTLLLSGIMAYSAWMYFTKYEMVTGFFSVLNYPPYLVYPLAIAKILGIIAIVSRKSSLLKEWAYAGFFFDTILAWYAHFHAGHGIMTLSLLAIALVVASRIAENFQFPKV